MLCFFLKALLVIFWVCPCLCSVKWCLDDSVLLGFFPDFLYLLSHFSVCEISDRWYYKEVCHPVLGNRGIGSCNVFPSVHRGTIVVSMCVICGWVSLQRYCLKKDETWKLRQTVSPGIRSGIATFSVPISAVLWRSVISSDWAWDVVCSVYWGQQ